MFPNINGQNILRWFQDQSQSELRELAMSVAAGLVVVLSAFFSWVKRIKKQRGILEQLALRHNGVVQKGALFSLPRLILTSSFGEVQIYATSGSKSRPSGTFFCTEIHSGSDFECTIGRIGPQNLIGVFSRQKMVRLNSPSFDEHFLIQTNDPTRIAPLTALAVQSNLLGLKELDPRFQIRKGRITFSVAKMMESERQYDDFIATGMMLLERVHKVG
jgi:hypothetical protein